MEARKPMSRETNARNVRWAAQAVDVCAGCTATAGDDDAVGV